MNAEKIFFYLMMTAPSKTPRSQVATYVGVKDAIARTHIAGRD
jgi:hypothetical protein